MAIPTEADLSGPLAPEIKRYMETDTASRGAGAAFSPRLGYVL